MLGERISKFFNRERAGESVKEVRFKSGAVLRFTEKDGEFSFELKKGDAVVNLLDFAPPGTRLVRKKKERWGAELNHEQSGAPAIFWGGVRGVHDLMSFLHEAGHLQDAAGTRAVGLARDAHNKFLNGGGDDDYSPKRMRAMAHEWRATRDSEYGAWEYALKAARRLDEERDLKIFDELGEAEGVQKFIRKHIISYENRQLRELSEADIKDADEMERYFTGLLTGGEADRTDEKQKN